MTDFDLHSLALNILYLGFGLALIYGALRWFNKSLGVNFGAIYRDTICSDPMAAAVYHGLRFIGIGIFASAFVS